MHQFFEMSIAQVIALPDKEFLDLCEEFLTAALKQQEDRDIDYQARMYAKQHLDMELWGEFDQTYGYDFNF